MRRGSMAATLFRYGAAVKMRPEAAAGQGSMRRHAWAIASCSCNRRDVSFIASSLARASPRLRHGRAVHRPGERERDPRHDGEQSCQPGDDVLATHDAIACSHATTSSRNDGGPSTSASSSKGCQESSRMTTSGGGRAKWG